MMHFDLKYLITTCKCPLMLLHIEVIANLVGFSFEFTMKSCALCGRMQIV